MTVDPYGAVAFVAGSVLITSPLSTVDENSSCGARWTLNFASVSAFDASANGMPVTSGTFTGARPALKTTLTLVSGNTSAPAAGVIEITASAGTTLSKVLVVA